MGITLRWRRLYTLFCLGSALFLLSSCSAGDDWTAIHELLKEGVQRAEDQDLGGILHLTTEDFLALPGKLDRRETRRILWMAFQHYGPFKVLHPKPSVEMNSSTQSASALFPFLLVRKDASFPNLRAWIEDPQRWLEEVGENADLYRIRLELIREGNEWRVRRALLERFTGVAFSS